MQIQATKTTEDVRRCVAARAALVERGADVSEIFHFESGSQMPGPDPERSNYESFLSFNDPDGNSGLVQEVRRT